jgi:hypothetical protein
MQNGVITTSEETRAATAQGSLSSDQSSTFTKKPRVLRRVKSERPDLGMKQQSIVSITESAQMALANKPNILKSPSWSAGPTKSAKEGIAREWESLQSGIDDFAWQNEERELGGSQNPRELGRQLLFTQLEAQMPYWVVTDVESTQDVGEMLVGRWMESGRVRKRMAEWEDLMKKKKFEEDVEGGEMAMRFHDRYGIFASLPKEAS